MTSAAQYLLDFFKASNEQEGASFRRLYAASCELEDELKALADIGGRVQPYLDLIPRLRIALEQQARSDLSTMSTSAAGGKRYARIDERDLALLELAIERTELKSDMTPEREKTLRELLAAVREIVTSDESLDPQMRLFIVRAIVATENALDEYSITGEFVLRDALLNLFGLLHTAEATSDDPKRWRAAWEKYGVPATAGLIASVPQIALSGGALLQALGS